MTISFEIYWLSLVTLFTSLMWIPYIINRIFEMGLWPALYNPQPDTRPRSQWATRMMNAHENAIENLIIFAPLVIMTEITGSNSSTTQISVVMYFCARLIHFFVFTFGMPLVRVPAFLLGFVAQLLLALNLLQ